ncbi:hypothetical protein C0993_004505 [Termitomyces sp. T159_Od127]|nr:hypothetical protein C0993_004505 [Termitomyces sp. T159_Od127]
MYIEHDDDIQNVLKDVIQEATLEKDVLKKEFIKFWSTVGDAAGNENGLLSEAANNNKDGIKAFQLEELNDIVHQRFTMAAKLVVVVLVEDVKSDCLTVTIDLSLK